MTNVSMLIVMLVFSPLPGFEPWTFNSFNPLAQPSELPIPTPHMETNAEYRFGIDGRFAWKNSGF